MVTIAPTSAPAAAPTRKDTALVIAASSLGTIFEWYDFVTYGTLAVFIGRAFFPAGSEAAQLLLALFGFAIGFVFRPFGAAVFGYFGDKFGRKQTFLVTVALMGVATAGIGLVPGAKSIGVAAPILVLALRALQGLALGGEYGGAAVYIAEHAPPGKRGLYASCIQGSVTGAFVLSLGVVLSAKALMTPEAWEAWGWRVPFVFSLALLAVSLWIRLMLSESPVFKAMRSHGELSRNPLTESFTAPGNLRRIVVAIFGIAAGLSVIWYTSNFQMLSFLQGAVKVDPTVAQVVVGIGATIGSFGFLFVGWLSDKIGRKPPIVIGYILTLILLVPTFHAIGKAANPGLAAAMVRAPIVVQGADCKFDPLAEKQKTECGRLLGYFSKNGLAYTTVKAPITGVSISGVAQTDLKPGALDKALVANGYSLAKVKPDNGHLAQILLNIVILAALTALTSGSVAALLSELFPARLRYTSMSIAYNLGTGYFGGFLPVISQYIIAKTGNPYAGMWYTMAVVAMALVVTVLMLPETNGRDVRASNGR